MNNLVDSEDNKKRLSEKGSNLYELYKEASTKVGLNIFNVTGHMCIVQNKEHVNENLSLQDQIDLTTKNFGLKNLNEYNKDTYYGLLIDYGHNNQMGLHLEIDKLIELFPSDVDNLHTLKRRLAYLHYLDGEIKYIIEKYDFEKIPILIDWLVNKFERYATLTAELVLLILQYYHDMPNSESIRFKEFMRYIPDDDIFSRSIATTMDGFIIKTIRNEIVHGTGYDIRRESNIFNIDIDEVGIDLDFGITRDYVQEVFDLYHVEKVPGKTNEFNDIRFPYIKLLYYVSRNGTIQDDSIKIKIHLDMESYLKMASGYIHLLGEALIKKKMRGNFE